MLSCIPARIAFFIIPFRLVRAVVGWGWRRNVPWNRESHQGSAKPSIGLRRTRGCLRMRGGGSGDVRQRLGATIQKQHQGYEFGPVGVFKTSAEILRGSGGEAAASRGQSQGSPHYRNRRWIHMPAAAWGANLGIFTVCIHIGQPTNFPHQRLHLRVESLASSCIAIR
ncbi:hypothetical protein F5144DRAFT_552490 [Chaetomium tenue]|uniref:Uncharacterized protein n=1 Tax=Chaetomium tenue TaxID=1854479 RepID=A0ACB7PK66_9PEZI|nr:hypothetical protein F5144DRAFT_552490 [Chaetomium globosum]